MGLQQVKTDLNAGVPIWQKILMYAQGGFTLDYTGFTAGDTIKAGSIVGFDESTRIAKIQKVAIVQANATNSATAIRVTKGRQAKSGDYVAKTIGGAAYAITAIDTSNAAYDVLTVGTTLGVALTAGDVLYVSSATGAAAGAYTITPKGLLYEDAIAGTDTHISVVTSGTVYDRRIPGSGSVIQGALPLIIFSQSY